MRIYTQNAAPGLHKGKNRRLKKKFISHLQPKMGVIHGGGGIHDGVIHEMRHYYSKYYESYPHTNVH